AARGTLVLERERLRVSFHHNRAGRTARIDPAPTLFYLVRILRIDPFDEQILHVERERRHPPRDTFIVTARDARELGNGGADDVPARRAQVDEISERRIVEGAMRIAREKRLTGHGAAAGNDPRVAAAEPVTPKARSGEAGNRHEKG